MSDSGRTGTGADPEDVGASRLADVVPRPLRTLEPVACLALAGHAVAVQVAAEDRWVPLILLGALVLLLLGVVGLLGARSTTAVAARAVAVLVLGFVLQAVRVDASGYFLLWFFVLVSVYPLMLAPWLGRLTVLITPAAYLALLPLDAVDGPVGIAVVRAASLALIGTFVQRAAGAYRQTAGAYRQTADAYRRTAQRLARSEATAQEALATLQRALLPAEVRSPPDVEVAARYRAAGVDDRIGGDWYDTIALPAGGLALVIGDVEGHDLTAASVMGLVRGAVRSAALEGHPPSIVMERVRAFLLSAGIDRLVTMGYVQLYPNAAVATVALAGHPAPLVVPAGGGPVAVLDVPPGPVLGVEELCGWTERTVLLPPGSALVLYTDGLVAYPGVHGDRLDLLIERAGAVARGSAGELADTLIADAPSYDDAAVLVARMTSAGAPPLRRTLPARPISAGIARTWLTDLFELWRQSGVLPEGAVVADRSDVAQLLLTELVSNAVRHSDQSVGVQVEVRGQQLRVEVSDSSERMPVMRQAEAAATEGRGLRLVDALASAWGVRLDERGKAVWFELDLTVGSEPVVDLDDLHTARLLAAFAEADDLSQAPPRG